MLNAVVDLSHHNGSVDFAAARRDGILGVIHKATQGTGGRDPAYGQNRRAAVAAGLLWGAYHFGTGDDPAVQAGHFLDVAAPNQDTLLVLDFESDPAGPGMSLEGARTFVACVHARTGRWPGLYSGSYIRELLGDGLDPILGRCWLWMARYGKRPRVPANWPRWTMWQYTDGHSGPLPHEVAGIGRCDRDRFNGDEAGLRRLWCGITGG